jgi:hypothetical protein
VLGVRGERSPAHPPLEQHVSSPNPNAEARGRRHSLPPIFDNIQRKGRPPSQRRHSVTFSFSALQSKASTTVNMVNITEKIKELVT